MTYRTIQQHETDPATLTVGEALPVASLLALPVYQGLEAALADAQAASDASR